MKMSEMDKSEVPKHVLLYGMPKTGKTLLALRMAECGYNIKLIEGENGHTVGFQLPKEAQDRIDTIILPDTKSNPCMMQALSNLFMRGEFKPCVEHGLDRCQLCTAAMNKPFNYLKLSDCGPKDIIVLDTMTQWGNSILAHMALKQPEDWNPEFKDWRKLGTVLDIGLGSIQNSRQNWIVITHEVAHENQAGVEKIFPVAGTRNFSRNSAKYFDTVVFCEISNGKHVFASRSTYKNNVITGDRMGVQIENSDKGLLPIFEGDTSGNKMTGAAAALAALGGKK
jgi:hypothetical protein